MLEVDTRLPRLAAQIAGAQGVGSSILNKVGSALPEFKMGSSRRALLAYVEHPRVIVPYSLFCLFSIPWK